MSKRSRSETIQRTHSRQTPPRRAALTASSPAKLLVAAALCLTVVLAYAPALPAPFVMDDQSAIAESWTPHVQPPAGSPVAGRPVVRATLAMNHAINALLGVDQRADPDGPDKAVGYRLFNILAHLCTGALLFGVLRRSIRSPTIPEDWRALADPLAATACAVWLLHPIQTEAINYVVQRTELLASLCYVATLYASIRAWDAAGRGARFRWYAAGTIACALGMLCKEIVISAPLAVLLYDRAFRLPSWRAVLKPGAGRGWFYAVLVAACVIPFGLVSVGARGSTAGFATPMKWYEYLYSQCWAVPHYLRLIIWPDALSVDYGTQAVGGMRGIPGLIVLVVLAAGTIAAWTRVERWGWLAFLGTLFFMLLAPSSSIVPIGTEIAAERRVYLALIAVVVPAVVGAEWLRRRVRARISARQLGYCAGVAAVVLATLTAARSATYRSPEQLWRGAVREVPDNARAYVNLGTALVDEGPPRYAEAESAFRRAIAGDTTCRSGCAQLARLLAVQGKLAEATALFGRALAHDSTDGMIEQRLARAYIRLGQFGEAIPHLEHLESAQPAEQRIVVLAIAYYAVRRKADAAAAFGRAARLYPDNPAIRKLGGTLSAAALGPDALPHLQELTLSLTKDWQ
ncbi:MAG TPA: tetratricopeptide repeat protein [Gemmatimonadaceae bacterium]|jgi:Flp pilus assembly protein TadD